MSVKRIRLKKNSALLLCAAAMVLLSCVDNPQSPDDSVPVVWECTIPAGSEPEYSPTIGCKDDFSALASVPMSASIAGATSVKTVIDRMDLSGEDPLYFQNSKEYSIHYEFTSKNLSGGDLPIVSGLSQFNDEQYTTPDRRFVLGEITYYEGPEVWAYQIASNDNASADMIAMAFGKIIRACYFGDSLYFHPVSEEQVNVAKLLPDSVPIVTTDELYAGTDFQPLNFATSIGRLVFVKAEELDTAYVGFRDIVVLDAVPNDISVTSGIITEAFQTPLAHINVLSNNRGTPNMALRNAWTDSTLRSLENKWVKLEVTTSKYTIAEVSPEEADAWWEAHKPPAISIATMDTATRELRNVEDILAIDGTSSGDDIKAAIKAKIPAYGGKATHYSCFPHMDHDKVPYPKAFAIPVFYYWQFMEQNGFNAQMAQLLDDSLFKYNPAVRDSSLEALRKAMEKAPVDKAFKDLLMDKLTAEFPDRTMRFRSSTNAEDLDGFTGAGLYTSKSGDVDDPSDVFDAIREVWSSVWYFRAFEERSYRNIDHLSVGMALLVHHSFPDEEASGVAITGNIYDRTGLDPGFYVNVQYGDASVVLPDFNVKTDEFIYKFGLEGQPVNFISHSNMLPSGQETVLTTSQVHTLGIALQEIHEFFLPVYGSDRNKPYAMDTEFKFDQPLDDPTGALVLSIKQCRPYY
jgi:pyruvate,water dikinase